MKSYMFSMIDIYPLHILYRTLKISEQALSRYLLPSSPSSLYQLPSSLPPKDFYITPPPIRPFVLPCHLCNLTPSHPSQA